MMPIATVATRHEERGKVYVPANVDTDIAISTIDVAERIERLLKTENLSLPDELLQSIRPSPNARGVSAVTRFHLTRWSQLFTVRQLLTLLTFIKHIRAAHKEMLAGGMESGLARGVVTYIAFVIDKVAERGANVCRWNPPAEKIESPIANGKMPMVWDFPEANPFAGGSGSWQQSQGDVIGSLAALTSANFAPCVIDRSSSISLPFEDEAFDAIVTDPPYYDNIPYADLSDFFYVWLKRSVGQLYPEHFAGAVTPKKAEATALSSRHDGDMDAARREYETMMGCVFAEAHRVLKPSAPLICIYAHKTTSGWTTLVDAMRGAGFVVTEAWPINTEMEARLQANEAAALASNIFLVARKREGAETGSYEIHVQPELQKIVSERVDALWDQGISGADLVIACVGAGLRAFTRFARVEYASGEEVPAQRFLIEVEGVVLDTILVRLSKELGAQSGKASLAGLDPATRFYILWRYTYGSVTLEAGESIIFANGTHVELDGHNGLATGSNAILEKEKGKYRLLDFAGRGEDEDLGLPDMNGNSSPAVDALHRLLWLQKHRAPLIPEFLSRAQLNLEQLRLVAQSLAGPALRGGELKDVSPTEEQSELGKLLANWQAVVEGKEAIERRQAGQQKLV